MTTLPISENEKANIAGDLRALAREIASFAGREGLLVGGLVALGALLEGLSLALIVPLLGIVTGEGAAFGRLENAAAALFAWARLDTPFAQLAALMAVFGLVMIVRALVLYARDLSVATMQAGFVEALRLRIGERLAAASWQQLTRLRHARVTQLMGGEIQRVNVAAHFLLQGVVSLAMLLAQCILVVLLAPALAALAFAVLAGGAAVAIPLIRRAHGIGAAVTGDQLSLLDSMAQFLGGLKLAISQNLQGSFLAEFRATLRAIRGRQIAFVRQQTTSRLALTTLAAFAGGLLVLAGFGYFDIPPATLIVLLLVIARMSGPATRLLQGMQSLAHALPAFRTLMQLTQELAAIPPERDVPGAAAALAEGAVVFDDVTFLHAAEEEGAPGRGLRALSLSIAPGEFIGVGGPSGAGKTTFADLLVGLNAPQAGRITVAGLALEGAVLAAWRDRIGYISQDPFLFHDTVRRNLAWANSQAGEAEIWQALTLAGADALVRGMERGLDTVVGERGTLVSGGERQRLALARAVLRRPRLLVMDEATSAIDVAGERAILARLQALTPRPTIVVIAHRAESLELCDRVIYFEAGGRGTGAARPGPHGRLRVAE